MATITYYTRRDIFEQEAEAIINPVNCEGVMGKGLALEFKKRYPDTCRAYKHSNIQIGQMFIYPLLPDAKFSYIINFPTKDKWREPSKLEYIEKGLIDLVAQVKRLGIKSLAIPPLGCGLGGLNWYDVKPLIEQAFLELNDVDFFIYEP
jgi:O-acetyl-ADP-ribose deacetylase (regulator of RNase III)